MDQLSSCYFCGDALDASLEEHSVVPGELDPAPDTQQTVVLCRTCKRKLDAVLESVVAAVDEEAVTEERMDADAETGAVADEGALTGGDPSVDADAAGESASDIESTLGDDEDLLRPVGDGEDDVESASASDRERRDDGEDDSDSDEEGDGRKYTSSRRAGYTREEWRDGSPGPGSDGRRDGQSDEGGDETSGSTADETGEAPDGEAGEVPADETGEVPDGEAGEEPDGEAGKTASDEAKTNETASAGEADGADGADGGEPDVSLTRLENTKVMRLLKNREFPVERDDFVTVASSAYEVSPRDCDKVIDLAVEHDLLREEEGRLHAGSRWG